MYQVLLVDDEPLILSGIKFMLDWNKNNCQIAGTARNGQQAMEKIRTLHPDIVICDIAMPGMTGTELLQLAAKEFPHVVFIMLTNHPDFQLAQHSLRYRAVDYLLKSDLEPEALERSLAAAQAECRTRAKLNRVEMVDDYYLYEHCPGIRAGSGADVLPPHRAADGKPLADAGCDRLPRRDRTDLDERGKAGRKWCSGAVWNTGTDDRGGCRTDHHRRNSHP